MPEQNPMILPRIVMPVFHAEPLKEGGWKLLPSMIYGSCFSIGENYLLTARHVAETVEQTERKLAVGAYNPTTKLFTGLLVEAYEKCVALYFVRKQLCRFPRPVSSDLRQRFTDNAFRDFGSD